MSNNEISNYVKEWDKDRFLLAQFLPLEKRNDVMAIYAFNIELARIPESSNEEIIKMIRLEWWRETIEEIYNNKIRKHYISIALSEVIKKYNLPKNIFERTIAARANDFNQNSFEKTDDLIAYLINTSGFVTELENVILGRNLDKKIVDEISIKYGISGIIRNLSFNNEGKKIFIPQELNSSAENLAKLVEEEIDLCENKFFQLKVILSEYFLNKAKKYNYDVVNKDIENPRWKLILKLIFRYYF